MTVGTIAGIIFVVAFMFIEEIIQFQLPPVWDQIMSSDTLWGIIFAALIAGIDSLIYSAGQRLTQSERKYAYILDGAFISRNQKKQRKMLLKAAADFNDGEYVGAVMKLDKLIKKCGRKREYFAVHCLYGAVRDEQDKNEEALEHWKKAIEYENAKAYGYCRIANTYLKLHKLEEAIANGKKAIELDKAMYQTYETLCIAYKAIGDEEKFLVFHKAVIALNRNTEKFKAQLKAVGN